MKPLRDHGMVRYNPQARLSRFLAILVPTFFLLWSAAYARPQQPAPTSPPPTSPTPPSPPSSPAPPTSPSPTPPQQPDQNDDVQGDKNGGKGEQPETPRKGGIGFDQTPVGKQLEWVLRCINQSDAPDAQGRFAPRFLEQFTVQEAQQLLSTLKERTFKGQSVSLIEHLNEKRADAVTVLIGNEEIERYLSLLLTVNEETGKITGMVFSISVGGDGDTVNAWDAFDGEAGKLQNGVWFGAYEVNISNPGTPEADARISYVYEFGDFKLLNISSFSRVYLLIAAMQGVRDGQLTLDDKIKTVSGQDVDGAPAGEQTLREILIKTARGDERACDALLAHLSPSVVERTVINMQESPQFTLPYLSFAQRSMLLDPQNVELIEQFISDMGAQRREMVSQGGPLHISIAGKHLAKPWNPSKMLQHVGWFSSNKEAGYAMAFLRMLEQDPALKEVATLWRQEQPPPVSRNTDSSVQTTSKPTETSKTLPVAQAPAKPPRTKLDLDPKIWPEHAALSGSEPGVMTLGFLLKRDDNRYFTMVLAWNNIDGPLDEPRLYDLAQRGVEILAKHDRPQPEEPAK